MELVTNIDIALLTYSDFSLNIKPSTGFYWKFDIIS